MKNVRTFNKYYFAGAVLLFLIEICIALFAHDKIIRPYAGDFLVVILLYCFLKAFFNLPVFTAAVIVLIFSYVIEILQYFAIADKLGIHSKVARIIIGSSFEWTDLMVYTLGIIAVLYAENIIGRKTNRKSPALS